MGLKLWIVSNPVHRLPTLQPPSNPSPTAFWPCTRPLNPSNSFLLGFLIYFVHCIVGASHDFVDVQILADQFVKLINDMKLWIFDKEECLLGLVKQLTRILSDWDSDTEEMITKLNNARDKQVCKTIT